MGPAGGRQSMHTYVSNDTGEQQDAAGQLGVVAGLGLLVLLLPVALRHGQIVVAGRAVMTATTAVGAAQHTG